LDKFTFRRVTWTLRADSENAGKVASLVINPTQDDPCSVSFIDNVFNVPRPAPPNGPILDSEYSTKAKDVRVVATGCKYPGYFGTVSQRPLARLEAKGRWTFAWADLGDRDVDVALPTHTGVTRNLV